jgi:predicted Zn-dependent protease
MKYTSPLFSLYKILQFWRDITSKKPSYRLYLLEFLTLNKRFFVKGIRIICSKRNLTSIKSWRAILKASILFFLCFNAYALKVPEMVLSATLQEQKQGNEFLKMIWNTGSVVGDIEAQVYLNKLGYELSKYSENPNKHFGFFLLNDNSINAFAGAYGYIGVHTGMLLSSDTEAELAGVLSHEISHVTQNHLTRFGEKTSNQNYYALAGLLAAVLVNNSNVSQAIMTSTLAATSQRSINFTREHEWEADRIGTNMLIKSDFDPKGMANFFEKLKDEENAQEFLRSHPLSINRIAEAMQRSSRFNGDYRDNSFEYKTLKARLYYEFYKRIKIEDDASLTLYMKAYSAFEREKYSLAKHYIVQLLALNQTTPSHILAGRIYSKLHKLNQAQQYFAKVEGETGIYYAAQAYWDNQQTAVGIKLLRRYLKKNSGDYQSYKLLSALYVDANQLDRAHIYNAKALVVQGKLEAAIKRYERAKVSTKSQDLFDIVSTKINRLQKRLDLFEELP